jgi:hypothetical protein
MPTSEEITKAGEGTVEELEAHTQTGTVAISANQNEEFTN